MRPRLLAALVVAAAATAAPNAEARTFTFRSATIKLSAYETDFDVARRIETPRRDGFITRMSVRVVDAHGALVPQQRVMLHHTLFLNYGRFKGDRRGKDCTRRPREPFYGTGEEAQSLELPAGYGYRVRRRDRWTMAWMLMNHTHRSERVRLEYTVRLERHRRLTPVTPYWITTSCNRDRIYDVEGGGAPGSEHHRTRLWRVPENGRIVAAAGHAHGGARHLIAHQPRCGDRRLLASDASYGLADDPIYQASPVLHEPSPRDMSWALSASGWHIRRGERLRITSIYDGERPHTRVMGIMHIYVAPDRRRRTGCARLPADVERRVGAFPGAPGRPYPPPVHVQLSRRQPDGPATAIDAPPGAEHVLSGNATFAIRGLRFAPRRASVPAGARIRWRFEQRSRHDVTVADGPRGFSSPYSTRGDSFAARLTVPGDYRIFCSLHPVDMSQLVRVRPPG